MLPARWTKPPRNPHRPTAHNLEISKAITCTNGWTTRSRHVLGHGDSVNRMDVWARAAKGCRLLQFAPAPFEYVSKGTGQQCDMAALGGMAVILGTLCYGPLLQIHNMGVSETRGTLLASLWILQFGAYIRGPVFRKTPYELTYPPSFSASLRRSCWAVLPQAGPQGLPSLHPGPRHLPTPSAPRPKPKTLNPNPKPPKPSTPLDPLSWPQAPECTKPLTSFM